MKQVIYGRESGHLMYMTLRHKWFLRILSGVKKIEYREGKPYWGNRLIGNQHKIKFIRFANGYGSNVPAFVIQCLGIMANCKRPADPNDLTYEKDFSKDCIPLSDVKDMDEVVEYQIKLGNILETSNMHNLR